MNGIYPAPGVFFLGNSALSPAQLNGNATAAITSTTKALAMAGQPSLTSTSGPLYTQAGQNVGIILQSFFNSKKISS